MREAGLYDELITTAVAAELERLGDVAATAAVDEGEVAYRLADHIGRALYQEFPALKPEDALAVAQRVLEMAGLDSHVPKEPLEVLHAVGAANAFGEVVVPERPQIPLGQHDLLVNARNEPQLANELKREIASADQVDLIVAFVRWYGVRLIIDEIGAAIDRGAKVRLLTTTYREMLVAHDFMASSVIGDRLGYALHGLPLASPRPRYPRVTEDNICWHTSQVFHGTVASEV